MSNILPPPVTGVPPLIGVPPPIAPAAIVPQPRRFKARYIVAAVVLLLLCLSARAVAGYFFLGNEATLLRNAVAAHTSGQYQKKFAVRLGWMTTGLIRYGTRFVHMPPEPRAALDTLHRVEVGVYKLTDANGIASAAEILADTDTTMNKRGWERVVGVVHDQQTVAIYVPHKGLSKSNLECALLVLHDRDLIIAAGSGNPMPLIELASKKIEQHQVENE